MNLADVSLGGLFVWSFLAATLLPFSSEAALAAAQAAEVAPVWQLLAAASIGNTLGACANWALGRFLIHYRDRRWFPIRSAAIDRAAARFQRYGAWSLFFSWVPVIGDPLTFAAGMMQYRFVPFLVLVGLGKTLRYAAVLGLMQGFLP